MSVDGSIYLLYQAVPPGYTKKPAGSGYGNYVSSIGCAVSEDGRHFTRFAQPVIEPLEEYERSGCEDSRVTRLEIEGLWDFAWWVYQEVNFSPRIGEHCLLTLCTDCTDFFYFFSREFALFAVDFGSTMRNPKEPKLTERSYINHIHRALHPGLLAFGYSLR